jgi:hypothetical protein
VRRLGDHRGGIYGERLLRRVLSHQLHEEGLVQQVVRERMVQLPQRPCGEQRFMGEALGGDEAPSGSPVEEGKGALQDRRPAQEWERPGR